MGEHSLVCFTATFYWRVILRKVNDTIDLRQSGNREVEIVSLEKGECLDSTYDVIAPENVCFHYRLAGPFVRTVASMIDLLAIGMYLVTTTAGAAYVIFIWLETKLGFVSSNMGQSFFYTFWLCNLTFTLWFWNALLEAFWNGRTIGKYLLGLRTLTVSGRPIGRGQAFLRNILRFIDMILGPLTVLFMGMNGRMARLGDLASGTIVVTKDGKVESTFKEIDSRVVQNIFTKLPNNIEITTSLRKALTLYVSRRMEISASRRLEIAYSLVNVLSEEYGFGYRVEPDSFLCALYLRTL